jgi:hypothetical protein
MRLLVYLLALSTVRIWGADPPLQQTPFEISTGQWTFSGHLATALSGHMNKAKVTWSATIRNTSQSKIFRARFCVKAFDASDQEISGKGQECVLWLTANDWEPGTPLTFNGRQTIRLSRKNTPVEAAKYTIAAVEVLEHAPNLRYLGAPCPLVWSSALRVFADKKFRPTVMNKDSFTVTYAYDGGTSIAFLKAYTTANTAFLGPDWQSFRIDSASLYLREEKPGFCTAEVKMSFSGFAGPGLFETNIPTWYAVDSNFNFERSILDDIEKQSIHEASVEANTAASPASNLSPQVASQLVQEKKASPMNVMSVPQGAEVYVDDKRAGVTPLTFLLLRKPDDAERTVTVRLQGYKPYEQKFKPTGALIQMLATLQPEPASQPTIPEPAKGTTLKVSVVSIPDGADIEVDGNFLGSTPSAVELPTGEHEIVLRKSGYTPWQRKLKLTGGDIKISAELERVPK